MKEEFAHLADWVDVEEKRKETLKNGLLAFLKKHEKVLISELTKMFMNTDYKNTAELNAHIYTSGQYKEFLEHYKNVLGKRNRAKIRYETFKAFRDDLRTKAVNERELAKHI